MFINFKDRLIKNLNKNIVQPHRSQIYVGFKCSQHCAFCYYKSRCNDEMFSFDYIKKQIDLEYAYGIRDFEITGGEPSECKDLVEVCRYIKGLGKTKIAIITNGSLANIPVWDLIDEVLVSYHSGREGFDKNMFPNGSTYRKVMKTIQIARQHNKLIRINSLIASFNANMFDSIVDDLISFKPHIINILPINVFDESTSMAKYIDYDFVKPIIKRSLDKIKTALPDTLALVRYIPFCDMEGYEQHIVGNMQRIYDWFDWNSELCGLSILRLVDSCNLDDALKKLGLYGSTSLQASLFDINSLYHKPNSCMFCKYLPICDGLENNVDDKFAHCSKGKFEFDIMKYVGTKIQNFYRNWYHE